MNNQFDQRSTGAGIASAHPEHFNVARNANIASAKVDRPRDETVMEIFMREVSNACMTLSEVKERQAQQLQRLFGPKPENPNKDGAVQHGGSTGEIGDKLMHLRVLVSTVMSQQIDMERLG